MKCIPRPHFEDWNKPFQTWGIRHIALTVMVKEKGGRETSLEGKWWLRGKESAFSAGATTDMECIPGLGRCPGGGNGNLLQYSCLENSMGKGAWRTTVHGAAIGAVTWETTGRWGQGEVFFHDFWMVKVIAVFVCTLVGVSRWQVENWWWKKERRRNCQTDETV